MYSIFFVLILLWFIGIINRITNNQHCSCPLYLQDYHGELRIQEDALFEQRFLAVDEIPSEEKLDPVNKSVIELAIRNLTQSDLA